MTVILPDAHSKTITCKMMLKEEEAMKGDNEEPESYWKRAINTMGTDLSVSGLRYVNSKEEHIARRVIWVVLIISGLSIMCYQIADSGAEYYSRPVAVTTDDIYPSSLKFPTLTICNENRFVRSKVKALGLVDALQDLYPPFTKGPTKTNYAAIDAQLTTAYTKFGFASLEDFYRNMSYTPADCIYHCEFAGTRCNSSWFQEVWTDMGLCFQFNYEGQDLEVRRAGVSYGLSLSLNAKQHEYIALKDNTAGFRVLATGSTDPVTFNRGGLRVKTGSSTDLKIFQKQTLRLQPPYGNCSDEGSLSRFETYGKFNCEDQCLLDYLESQCGCVPVAYPRLSTDRICSLPEEEDCIAPAVRTYVSDHLDSSCVCAPECETTAFHLTETSNTFSAFFVEYFSTNITNGHLTPDIIRDDFVFVSVFFPTLSYSKLESQIAYSLTMLFNDLGGALGLMLGSTFFTIFEAIDILIWSGVYHAYRKKKVEVIQVKSDYTSV